MSDLSLIISALILILFAFIEKPRFDLLKKQAKKRNGIILKIPLLCLSIKMQFIYKNAKIIVHETVASRYYHTSYRAQITISILNPHNFLMEINDRQVFGVKDVQKIITEDYSFNEYHEIRTNDSSLAKNLLTYNLREKVLNFSKKSKIKITLYKEKLDITTEVLPLNEVEWDEFIELCILIFDCWNEAKNQ